MQLLLYPYTKEKKLGFVYVLTLFRPMEFYIKLDTMMSNWSIV